MSLRAGIEGFLESYESPSKLRQSVIDIHIAVELLLKERLVRENPLFVLRRLDEGTVFQEHLRRRSGADAPPWHEADTATVGFSMAVQRLSRLTPTVARHETSLNRLNELRNQLVHTGVSSRLESAMGLIAVDVRSFLDEFLPGELGMTGGQMLGDAVWSSARLLGERIGDQAQRAVQKKLALHRRRLETALPDDRLRFGALEISRLARNGGRWAEVPCPGCGKTSNAALVYESLRGDDGDLVRGPDGRPLLAGWPYLTRLECGDLELEGRELDAFLDIASEELEHVYGPHWRDPLKAR